MIIYQDSGFLLTENKTKTMKFQFGSEESQPHGNFEVEEINWVFYNDTNRTLNLSSLASEAV